MGCRKCKEYSFQLGRCKLGKINPKTVKGGVDAALVMGLDYICERDGMRAKVLDKIMKKAESKWH